MSIDLLTTAVDYVMAGWPIFPCIPRDKKPLTEHGLHDASADPDQAWWWWEKWPQANIGVATGKRLGMIVLDGDGEAGRATLATLEAKHGALPQTLTTRSGRPDGGEHRYFAHEGADIGNSAGRVGPGLDVRGQGGYIIAPPSVHESGNRYQWINQADPAPLPDWLRLMMLAPAAPLPRLTAAAGGNGDLLRRARVYVATAEGAGEGSRNGACFRLAGHLASFVGERGEALTEDHVFDLLTDFNRRCLPPLSEKELRAAVSSAMKNGKAREPKVDRPRPACSWTSPFSAGAA